MAKIHLTDALRKLLAGVLEARFAGASGAKFARAHGYADGYMRALQDAGLLTRDELLAIVGEENSKFVATDDARTVQAA